MPMPALARSWMAGAMAVLALGTVGCSPSYFTELMSVSTVRADRASDGKIDWTIETEDDGTQTAKSERTDPQIKLTLDANSSPVNYTAAQADFFYTEAAYDDRDKPVTNPIPLENVPTQYFPFATLLKTIDRATTPTEQTIPLSGLIPMQLIDITNPTAQGFQRLTAVVSTVTLKGTNGFGSPITTKVNVPIVINYTYN